MKVYFNANGTISNIPTDDTRFFQNSGNSYIYLYGIPEGKTITLSFTKPDKKRYGPYEAWYAVDGESVDCVKGRLPAEIFDLAGGVEISILVQHEEEVEIGEGVTTTEIVRDAYAKVGITVYPNDSVVVP